MADSIMPLLQLQQAQQQAQLASSPEQDALLEAIYRKQEEADRQRKLLLQQQLANQLQTNPSAIDWTPLAAQLEQSFGVKAPVAAAQSNLKAELSDRERTQDLFDSLVGKNAGSGNLANMLNQAGREKRFQASQAQKMESELGKANIKINNDASNIVNGFNAVEKAFTPDEQGKINVARLKTALSLFSRSVSGEKGALNEGDIGRTVSADLEMRIGELTNLISGAGATIDASKILPQIQAIVDKKQSAQMELSNRLRGFSQTYGNLPSYSPYFQEGGAGQKLVGVTQATIDQLSGGSLTPDVAASIPKPTIQRGAKTTLGTVSEAVGSLLGGSGGKPAAPKAKPKAAPVKKQSDFLSGLEAILNGK